MSIRTKNGKRAAYVHVLGVKLGEYRVALCVENEDGYRPLDADYSPGSLDDIKGLVDRLNDRIGVTRDEAVAIALTTMKTIVPGSSSGSS